VRIVFDKFHIAQYLGNAVDLVRRAEHRELMHDGDPRLKGTRYSWLRNPHNMSSEQRRAFEPLRKGHLTVARAWAIKELAMSLWGYKKRGWADRAWTQWYS
jgi:transposase